MEKIETFFYCSYSETIRQAPQNYMLATSSENGEFLLNTDAAANKFMVNELYKALQNSELRKCCNVEKLIKSLNQNEKDN